MGLWENALGVSWVGALRWIRAMGKQTERHWTGTGCRLLSYNILADGRKLALSDKHAYCPLTLREWAPRKARLVSELRNYNADIICLQEVTESACAELASELQPEWTLCGHLGLLTGVSYGIFPATFLKEGSGEVVAQRGVLFKKELAQQEEEGIRRFRGATRQKLLKFCQTDGLVALVIKQPEHSTPLLIANVHLYWNPNYPHVKAAQAELAVGAACFDHVLETMGCAGERPQEDDERFAIA